MIKQICSCGKEVLYLKYGRCESCFQAWADHDNPEPCAKKKRKEFRRDKTKGRRGAFVAKLEDGLYFTPKRKESVTLEEAFVFAWLNSALEKSDIVEELKPIGTVTK